MAVATAWVNPTVLRQLREEMGLAAGDVERESEALATDAYAPVRAAQLEQWELGEGLPELEHLETLAELYQCPVGYFFLSALPERPSPLSFRGLAPGKEEALSFATRSSLKRFLELAEWVAGSVEEHAIDWPVRLPLPGEEGEDPERLAETERGRLGFSDPVREEWQSAGEAFAWWRRRLEAQGVFCFEFKLEPKEVRGASLWLRGRYPFILVNHQDAEAATGRLFTLLHEYGHLLLERERQGLACDFRGRDGGSGLEPIANRFAAHLLLAPARLKEHLVDAGLIGSQVEEWTDAELRRLADRFWVSRDVVAITLEGLALAPDGFYRKKQREWEKRYERWTPWGRGKSLKKWERKARELGSSTLRVVLKLHELESLPALDAAYLLDTKVERLGEFLRGFESVVSQRP
jgi:Zn-dependent peptidase ImmA (M78 family)/transcriptional regulator with XRE-family HTH domain